jgi:hypothetical protein
LFDLGYGASRFIGLPDEDSREHEAGYDRENHGLPEGPLESFEFQAFSSFFRVYPDLVYPGYRK